MSRRLLLVLAVLVSACIERPQPPGSKARNVDRSELTDVILQRAPTPQVPVGAVFDDAVELVGYDLEPAKPKAGDQVTVTFWWKARDEVYDDWQIFVHLEDATDTNPRRLADHYPADGRYRTAAWRAGDIIKDQWSFRMPRLPGRIQLWTGLFIGNQRMPLTSAGRGRGDGADRVRAGVVVVP